MAGTETIGERLAGLRREGLTVAWVDEKAILRGAELLDYPAREWVRQHEKELLAEAFCERRRALSEIKARAETHDADSAHLGFVCWLRINQRIGEG